MNHRLKKALSYGVQFFVFAPLMGFLVLAVFAILGMIFLNGNISMGVLNLINLLLVLFWCAFAGLIASLEKLLTR